MAFHESDREDLMREAVALVRRVELEIENAADTVICGFRRNGALAVYFGADPVYQFDDKARLRRAFVEGLLYRTQGTTLAALKRHRTEDVTELLRRDLTKDQMANFLNTMLNRIRQLHNAIDTESLRVIGQVPPNDPILPDLLESLRRILHAEGALAPQIKGKR